jgi:DNA-binding CsgD family transcriptional regulator
MQNGKKHLFDEYIIQGEPSRKQRAENWQIAIGLQDVDGLSVSPYLIELAKRNIEGEITIDEVRELIADYYRKKHEAEPPVENAEYYGYIIEPSPPGASPSITPAEAAVLNFLNFNPRATQKMIAEKIGKSVRTVRSLTKGLQDKDMLARKDGKRNGVWEVLL